MWQDILKLAMSDGLWAVLFLGLLIYELKDSRAREGKYQKTITDLTDAVGNLDDMKNNLNEIEEDVKIVGEHVVEIKNNLELNKENKKTKLKVVKPNNLEQNVKKDA